MGCWFSLSDDADGTDSECGLDCRPSTRKYDKVKRKSKEERMPLGKATRERQDFSVISVPRSNDTKPAGSLHERNDSQRSQSVSKSKVSELAAKFQDQTDNSLPSNNREPTSKNQLRKNLRRSNKGERGVYDVRSLPKDFKLSENKRSDFPPTSGKRVTNSNQAPYPVTKYSPGPTAKSVANPYVAARPRTDRKPQTTTTPQTATKQPIETSTRRPIIISTKLPIKASSKLPTKAPTKLPLKTATKLPIKISTKLTPSTGRQTRKPRPRSQTLQPYQLQSTRPKCPICGKTAYLAESVEYNKVMYHKLCFKCQQCRIKLNVHTISPADGKFYCKRCFNAVTIAKGNEKSTKREDYGEQTEDVITNDTPTDGLSRKERYVQEYSINMHKRSLSREESIKKDRQSTIVKIDKTKKQESAKLIDQILKDKQTRGLENQLQLTSEFDLDLDLEKKTHSLESAEGVPNPVTRGSVDQIRAEESQPGAAQRAQKSNALILNNNPEFRRLTPSQYEEKMEKITDFVKKSPNVEVLSFTNCGLGNDFVATMGSTLEGNQVVNELNLESNNLSGPAYKSLAQLLRNNSSLRVLKLRNQTLRPSHTAQLELLEALEENTTLTTLGFDFTQKHQNDLKRKYLDRNLDLRRIERNKKKQLESMD